ncbi:MAG: type III pantothenate kinase [Flavobacteriaceae bacterium]|nr:type III pantothenate kinase [Flavobacteriaceae bacterium]
MNLIVDAGNTSVKLALFKEGEMLLTKHIEPNIQTFKRICEEFGKISSILICDVQGLDWSFLNTIFDPKNIFILDSTWKLPFINSYKTPKTLGADRIGLIAAAVKEYPNSNVLVIDLGSCITYDLIKEDQTYLGGMISPGYTMRYKSLNTFTGKLPLVENETFTDDFGDDTKTSIQAGIFNGILHEIEGQIEFFRQKNENLTIILTGGDCLQLSKRLKNPIFAHPNFLVKGLDYLLQFNKK